MLEMTSDATTNVRKHVIFTLHVHIASDTLIEIQLNFLSYLFFTIQVFII